MVTLTRLTRRRTSDTRRPPARRVQQRIPPRLKPVRNDNHLCDDHNGATRFAPFYRAM